MEILDFSDVELYDAINDGFEHYGWADCDASPTELARRLSEARERLEDEDNCAVCGYRSNAEYADAELVTERKVSARLAGHTANPHWERSMDDPRGRVEWVKRLDDVAAEIEAAAREAVEGEK